MSAPLIVKLSAFIFNEFDTLKDTHKLIGVLLAIAAAFILMQWRFRPLNFSRGIALALISMIASAGAALAAKFVFISEGEISIFGFMIISNLTNLILATLRSAFIKEKVSLSSINISLGWGVVIGLLNFFGFTAFLLAIKYGDLSLVASINNLYILIPVLLSAWFYGEQLTLRKQFAVVVSIIALILIK